MFELEARIKAWRSELVRAGLNQPERLNELESHLREEIETLVSSGLKEADAFNPAVSRLGSSAQIQTEFQKIKGRSWLPLTIVLGLVVSMLSIVLFVALREIAAGNLSLLFAHVVSLTAGCCAGLITGVLGICYFCWRLFGNLTPTRLQPTRRALLFLNYLSTGLIATGFILGMLWARKNLGRFFGGDPREIGGLCVTAWFIATAIVQQFFRISDRKAMLMCISGNIVIILGWFGANMFTALQSYGFGTQWLFELLLGVHLIALLLGFIPADSLPLRTPRTPKTESYV